MSIAKTKINRILLFPTELLLMISLIILSWKRLHDDCSLCNSTIKIYLFAFAGVIVFDSLMIWLLQVTETIYQFLAKYIFQIPNKEISFVFFSLLSYIEVKEQRSVKWWNNTRIKLNSSYIAQWDLNALILVLFKNLFWIC